MLIYYYIFCFLTPQGLLDLMIAEEEELKKRLVKSIESCLKELKILYSELQLPPFEVQSLKLYGFLPKAVWFSACLDSLCIV